MHMRIIGGTVVIAAALTGTAWAQSAPGSHAEPIITASESRDRPDVRFKLTPRITHAFETELDDSGADVSVTRAGVAFGMSLVVNPKLRMGLNLDIESSHYDFGQASALPGGDDPIDGAGTVRFGPSIFYAFDQHWSVFGGFGPEFSGEHGAEVGDSVTFGGFGGARYAFSEKFALSFGLQARTRIEEDARVLPLLGVEWQITEHVRLTTEGPGVRLTVRIDDTWSFNFGGAWESRDFRLDDDSSNPEGILRDTRGLVVFGVDFSPRHWVTLSAYGGAVVWQEFRFDDREGNELLEDNADPTVFAGFSATFRF